MPERFDVRGEERAEGLARASELLRSGRLAVVPTDTVYGVAADAFDPDATARVFTAKDRSRSHPLPVMIRSQKQLPAITSRADEVIDRLVAAFWPGPLTIVVPAHAGLRWDLGHNDGTVAVRMPLDPVTLELIRTVGPLAVTSANRSGHPPAQDVDDAQRQLGEAVDVYLDDGHRDGGVPSTIVDITRRTPAILREGVLPATQVLGIADGSVDPFSLVALDAGDDPRPDVDAALAQVRGLGPVRRERLLATFDEQALRAATVEELVEVEGIGPRLAEQIVAALR